MKKHFLAASLLCASVFMIFAKGKDPVLMTVAGKDVPLSEFEYLYNKNNSQQATPQSIEEYVGMFVDYKLKVADAEAAGIDTTRAFLDEFTKFRDELSEPYLRDNSVLDSMVAETYSRMASEVTVSHIMLPKESAAVLDSVRREILAGRITFEKAAERYSIDKPSAARGGLMGVVVPGRFPQPFEDAAYSTAEGEISPVINSGVGQHIVRVEKRRPARGEVNASHIIRLTRGMDATAAAKEKAMIDSIYRIVKNDPSKFEALARQYSQDGSAANGGSLGWFSPGMMVAEFENVAFDMPVGGVSEPFTTVFGWHIIKKNDARGIGPLDEMRASILKGIEQSPRAQAPVQAYLAQSRSRYNASLAEASFSELGGIIDNGGAVLDSAMMSTLQTCSLPAYYIGKNYTTVAQVLPAMMPKGLKGKGEILEFVKAEATRSLDAAVLDLARNELYASNADYRNLVNEYRDGILLFEISNRNVWDRGAKDRDGLEKFFEQNRDKYVWDTPKFKSYIFYAENDSVLNAATAHAATAPAGIAPTDFVKFMREKVGLSVKIERVIAAKGDNPLTDYLGFGGPKPAPDKRWKSIGAFNGRVITAPTEAADVRGAVLADYQNALEKEWLDHLHTTYPVKLNKKLLKKVK